MLKERKSFEERLKQEAHSRIVKILKETTESSADLQINHTPPEICSMMLDKVDLSSAKNVLALFNVEFLYELRLREYKGDVYYFTQSEKEVAVAKELMPNVIIKYIDKKESALEYMNTWPEKFDIIVSNPPYAKYLHIKFIEKSLFLCKGKMIFVHPSNSFVNKKTGNDVYEKFNGIIESKLEEVFLFNGCGIFGINLFTPCSITTMSHKREGGIKIINKLTNQTYDVNRISEITQLKSDERLWKIKTKIDSYVQLNGSLDDILKTKGKGGDFMIDFTRIRGHIENKGDIDSKIHKKDFFTFVSHKTRVEKKDTPKYDLWFRFKTEKEALGLLKYLKSDFARFSLSLYKFSQSLNNGELRYIPLIDFTQEWTDARLYEHFGITEEEQAFIKEIIPPYYD